MSIFPGAIASFLGFTSSHTLSADQHASQHNSEQAEIVAAQTKIGTGSSTPTSGLLLRGTGAGTSSWAQANLTSDVTGVLPTANGGSGTTLLTFPSGTDTLVARNTTDTLTNKTLTTPTIASFINATHNHESSVGGGTLNATNALQNSTVTADKLATGAQAVLVDTSETSTSTSYVDLTTTTDSVTVTIGVNGLALVTVYAELFPNVANTTAYATFQASGANTIAANDFYAIAASTASAADHRSATHVLTGLTPGSTTFKMKYRVGGATTGTWQHRRIGVVPL